MKEEAGGMARVTVQRQKGTCPVKGTERETGVTGAV